MKYLGVDLETGGAFALPQSENFITELGAAMWDTDLNGVGAMIAEIIDFGKPVDPEAAEYNGISQEMVTKYGLKGDEIRNVFMRFGKLMEEADFIVAHSGRAFDKPILEHTFKSLEIPFPTTEWLDSREDVQYPRNCKAVSLTYLQCFHGFAYPGHRAIFDIMAMLRIFTQYDIEQIKTWARSPMITIRAVTKNINWKNAAEVAAFEEQKAKIKKAGFRWNQEGFEKLWVKQTKEIFFEKEKDTYDFPYAIIAPKESKDKPHGADKSLRVENQSSVVGQTSKV